MEDDIETLTHRSTTLTLHDSPPYDVLKRQRDALLEAEKARESRIKQLERNSEKVAKEYEKTHSANGVLKNLLDYGPAVTKAKKLRKENKEKDGTIEKIKEENHALSTKLKHMERKLHVAKSDARKAKWDAVLTKAKYRRDTDEAIPTNGPFEVNSPAKKIAIDEPGSETDDDAYDVQLHNIKHESEMLVNKINQLNREKEQIDLTRSLGRNNIIRNAHIVSVIGEKLNRDLNKYTQRLDELKVRHDAVKLRTDKEIEVKEQILTDIQEIRSVRSHKKRRNLNQEAAYFTNNQNRLYRTQFTRSMLDLRSGDLAESVEMGKRILSLKALKNQKLTSTSNEDGGGGLRQLSQDRNTIVHQDSNYTPPCNVALAYEMDRSQNMMYTCTCMDPIPVRFRGDGKTIDRQFVREGTRNKSVWK